VSFDIIEHDEVTTIVIRDAAVFSNLIPYKKRLDELVLNQKGKIHIDFRQSKYTDHSFMAFIESWVRNNQTAGEDRIKLIRND
jgi:hypothetical protein